MDASQNNPQPNASSSAAPAPSLDLSATRRAIDRKPGISIFWSNLRDFLTERPVKIRRGSEPSAFESEGFGSSMSDNFREFWRPTPRSARRVNSDLLVTEQSWLRSFWGNIRDTIAPKKLPPLETTSQPVDVPEIWSKNKQFTKVQALSLAIHVAVIVLIVLPLLPEFVSPPTQANTGVQRIEVSEFLPMLKMGSKKAGGGGGRANTVPANKGRLPTLSMLRQLTPPVSKPHEAKLQAQASVMVPNIHIPEPNMPNVGDPTSALINDSMGNGSGSGLGSGNGAGLGAGSDSGVGGGPPMAGENGYSRPDCLYCPTPAYSDAGFKLKIQGPVVLDIVVDASGRATSVHVDKGLGYGLDEEAVKAVRDIWRFKPAIGPSGQPAMVRMLIEIDFHLY